MTLTGGSPQVSTAPVKEQFAGPEDRTQPPDGRHLATLHGNAGASTPVPLATARFRLGDPRHFAASR